MFCNSSYEHDSKRNGEPDIAPINQLDGSFCDSLRLAAASNVALIPENMPRTAHELDGTLQKVAALALRMYEKAHYINLL